MPLLIALVLVVVAAGTETAFRLFWRMPLAFAEFEPQGLYTARSDGSIGLAPGYRGSLQVGPVRTEVTVNSLGMRGPEPGRKQPGDRRVLMAGDSLVFGYGVAAKDALPAQLQRELGALGKPATVGNAGVPGFGSRETAAAAAAHDAPFGADAFVVCGYLGNDAADELRTDCTVNAGQKFDGPMARLVASSWRMKLAVRSRAMLWWEAWVFTNHPTWSPLMQQAPSEQELGSMRGLPGSYPAYAGTFGGLFLDAADATTRWDPAAPPVIPRTLAVLRASLQRAKELAGARPLLFVVLPTLSQVDEALRLAKLRGLGFDPTVFPRGTAQRRWLAVARELGIEAVDATVLLAAESGDLAGLFLVDQCHFSDRGNTVVARGIAAALAAQLR